MEKNNRSGRKAEGWDPDVPTGEGALADEERSDIGESGQFAPGGYYNQQTVDEPSRRPLGVDDDITPPGRN